MPLCSKCHQKVATVHITTVINDAKERKHYCPDCAPPTGLEGLTLEQIRALSPKGRKCDFCGEDAFSGVRDADEIISWCRPCGMERSRIARDLLAAEHPGWPQQLIKSRTGSPRDLPPQYLEWIKDALQRAVQILKNRRQNGHDKSR